MARVLYRARAYLSWIKLYLGLWEYFGWLEYLYISLGIFGLTRVLTRSSELFELDKFLPRDRAYLSWIEFCIS